MLIITPLLPATRILLLLARQGLGLPLGLRLVEMRVISPLPALLGLRGAEISAGIPFVAEPLLRVQALLGAAELELYQAVAALLAMRGTVGAGDR